MAEAPQDEEPHPAVSIKFASLSNPQKIEAMLALQSQALSDMKGSNDFLASVNQMSSASLATMEPKFLEYGRRVQHVRASLLDVHRRILRLKRTLSSKYPHLQLQDNEDDEEDEDEGEEDETNSRDA